MKKLLLIPLVLALAGCIPTKSTSPYGGWYNYTKYTEPTEPSTAVLTGTYDASYDKVWDALIDTISENGMHIQNMDKNSGFLVLEGALKDNVDSVIDCGTDSSYGQLGKSYTSITHRGGGYWRETAVRAVINVRLKKESKNRIKVTLNPTYYYAVAVLSGSGRTWFKDVRTISPNDPAVFTSYQFLNNSYENRIVCVPTYKVEQFVLNSIQSNLRK